MAIYRGVEATGGRRRTLARGLACLVLFAPMLVSISGCGGCGRDPLQGQKDAEERAKKKKEAEPKPDFEGPGERSARLTTRPTGEGARGVAEPLGVAYKPGHWTATTFEAKANNFDFVGDLAIQVTDGGGSPIPLVGLPYNVWTSCQVTLGKGQRPRSFESLFFVPSSERLPRGHWQLTWRKGSRRAWESIDLLSPMPPYQYHLVVIAAFPENYLYVEKLGSVEPPAEIVGSESARPYYRVSMLGADKPDPRRRLALPSYGLLWTSIACVLWDNAAPDALDASQQQAMLDWLHWGGQLIVSGPGSLDRLGGSFLEPYLPATAAPGGREFTAADFEPLHRWSTASREAGQPLAPPKTWSGVGFEKHPDARFVPGSGELLVERRVGRGRIVVSAFALAGNALKSWPGTDEMYNAMLLGHPPRQYTPGEYGGCYTRWADDHNRDDAACISNVRYFSRDLRSVAGGTGFDVYLPDSPAGDPDPPPVVSGGYPFPGDLSLVDEAPAQGPGVAAWNDFNPVAESARTTLQNAAAIEIPKRSFVVWVVLGYLLILVPANWAVFRVINRVEWAWVAAPVIAVACTALVVRLAQLDIGFARSQTEIAVVELQGDLPRAHVTRYTALYTSLTTSYEFHSDDPGALMLPFSGGEDLARNARLSPRTLLYRRGVDASLTGYSVQSTSTGLVHSEQMVDLGGGLSVVETPSGRLRVANQTQLTLHDVEVVRKDGSGNRWAGSLDGPLEPGESRSLQIVPRSEDSENEDDGLLWTEQHAGTLLGRSDPNRRSLMELAGDDNQLRPGEVRLLAWTDQRVPGLDVRPVAPQSRFATLIVAHSKYGFGDDPKPDANVPTTTPPLLEPGAEEVSLGRSR